MEDGEKRMAHVRKVLRRHTSTVFETEEEQEYVRRWAANLLARTRPEYSRAWAKMITGRGHLLDNEERAAIQVGSNDAGGFLVPTFLDPTIILTNDGTSNAIRGISRVVTIVNGANQWKGITSAGSTASWDGEIAEVSDDSPNDLAQPAIDVWKAQGLIQASLESLDDIPSLVDDVLMLLSDARDRLEGAAHAVGAGDASKTPTGIFTALNANTNVQVVSTTAAAIGLVDIDAMYLAVKVRWRGKSRWLMAPKYNIAIKDLGTAVSNAYTTDLTQAPSGVILGRPVTESDDAPTTQTTTQKDPEIILGDFSNYVVVDKPGSFAVEYIPHLFNTTTNLPDGRRAWYAHWRNGADSVNDKAFRLLVDKTSA
jgi:HK97 family phage major capsid protein